VHDTGSVGSLAAGIGLVLGLGIRRRRAKR
jgi:uncharacterized protein (TIGR03382 family)